MQRAREDVRSNSTTGAVIMSEDAAGKKSKLSDYETRLLSYIVAHQKYYTKAKPVEDNFISERELKQFVFRLNNISRVYYTEARRKADNDHTTYRLICYCELVRDDNKVVYVIMNPIFYYVNEDGHRDDANEDKHYGFIFMTSNRHVFKAIVLEDCLQDTSWLEEYHSNKDSGDDASPQYHPVVEVYDSSASSSSPPRHPFVEDYDNGLESFWRNKFANYYRRLI